MSLKKATRGCVYGTDPEMRLRDSLLARCACGGCSYHVYIVLSSLVVVYISFKEQRQPTIVFVSILGLFAFPLIAFAAHRL